MEWAQHIVEQYGYWAVFIWTFIEGETALLVAAALASAGLMEPYKLIAIAAFGAFAGHLFFFWIGRWHGLRVIRSVPFLLKHYPRSKELLDKYLDQYGAFSIFIFQYLYGTRLVTAILFGCSSIKFWRFFLLQAVNCTIWAIVIYSAGHLLGLGAQAILHRFGIYGLLIVAATAATVAAWTYFRYGHHHVKHHFRSRIYREEDR